MFPFYQKWATTEQSIIWFKLDTRKRGRKKTHLGEGISQHQKTNAILQIVLDPHQIEKANKTCMNLGAML